jgi:hypothetical protein
MRMLEYEKNGEIIDIPHTRGKNNVKFTKSPEDTKVILKECETNESLNKLQQLQ